MILNKKISVLAGACLWALAIKRWILTVRSFPTTIAGKSPRPVCPLTMTMEVEYKFIFPVDPDKIKILYIWNDGTPARDTVDAVSFGDTLFRAVKPHFYQPSDSVPIPPKLISLPTATYV
jgi:hypothetical protein